MDKSEVQSALEALREIKGAQVFYDVHVHPYEMMFAACDYSGLPVSAGLYSAGALEYQAPHLADLNPEPVGAGKGGGADKKFRAMACLLGARRSYSHTGPRVFGDQMALCGVDRLLLLPVMAPEESTGGQMKTLSAMLGNDERFLLGHCVANDIRNDQVEADVRRAVAEHGVRALKIHPSVTGIDLGRREGVERVEAILDAARGSRLKVIIHGGMSPDCKNSQAICYGKIENLEKVDWSITSEPVVVAHGGCFGHSAEDAREAVIPAMARLLGRHPHLHVDTSGIGVEVLCRLLQSLAPERILFGSDALYEKQWTALVRLWLALRETQARPEDALLRIVSGNPGRLFGKVKTKVPVIQAGALP